MDQEHRDHARRELAQALLPAARAAAIQGPAVSAAARAGPRYAYHFFFNRMIPLPSHRAEAGYPIYRLKLERLAACLLPGASPGLDTICEGILAKGRRSSFAIARSG